MSLCTICGTNSSCRKARPVAVPKQIAALVSQSNLTLLVLEPAKQAPFSVTNSEMVKYFFDSKQIYQTVLDQGSYFLNIHRLRSGYVHQDSIQSTQPDWGV